MQLSNKPTFSMFATRIGGHGRVGRHGRLGRPAEFATTGAPKLAKKMLLAHMAALATLAASPKPVVFFIRRNHALPTRPISNDEPGKTEPRITRIVAKGTSLAANSSFAPIREIRGQLPIYPS
jgi:hypothetical protein